jgi:hypothetical protein
MDLSIAAQLDALMDIERLNDPRIVPFLLDVLTDTSEPGEVRLHALKRVRDGSLVNASGFRELVARAMLRVLQDQRNPQLRLHAALALGEFTEVDGVPTALGATALDHDVPLDLRYSAFASLERALPAPECVALVRQLLPDDALGVSARSLLSVWRLGNSHDA